VVHFLYMHEACHIGRPGMIRRLPGKPAWMEPMEE
jgi:hypothetical protein